MKILLHICCAPCAIYPLKALTGKSGNNVTGFFYNPNIHPAAEEERRRNAAAVYAAEKGLDIFFGEYKPEDFFAKIGVEQAAPLRCSICWRMRLEKAAGYAAGRYEAFTTTLLASPYQNRQEILKICAECGEKFGIEFVGSDFRGGFREAQKEAKERGIYKQKYCGCVYSEKQPVSTRVGGRPLNYTL